MTKDNLKKGNRSGLFLEKSSSAPNNAQAEALCRSGAAARIADIPVATLRVWERRYGAVGLTRSASGQRLYGTHDIKRLVLLKKLVGLGHAIGTIAALSLEALQSLAAARKVYPQKPDSMRHKMPAITVCVAGSALAHRLNSDGGRRVMTWSNVELVACFDDAGQALETAAKNTLQPADMLLVHLSSLYEDLADQVLLLQPSVPHVLVVYDFGAEYIAQRLRDAGIDVHRDPFSLVELLALITKSVSANAQGAFVTPGVSSPPPRRYGDDALLDVASASSTIACECPQHLATILMKLSAFEVYSEDCLNRNSADAQLHAYLKDITGSARALFEFALERVATAEGLTLRRLP